MANLDKIRSRDRRPCYVLRVAGLPVLYGTHRPPELTADGVVHARRVALQPDSISFSRRIDENARVVEVGNLVVTMQSDELYTSDEYDPGKIFGRIGYRAADYFSRVTESVTGVATSTVTISVDKTTGLQSGDIVHLGQETLEVISVTSHTVSCNRGFFGTFPRAHTVNNFTGSFPYLTKPLTYFRGRRVLLYEGTVNSDGSVSSSLADYVEVFRGFIAAEPETAKDGRLTSVSIELAPFTAVLDKELPTSDKGIRLHPTIHTFDGFNCHKICGTTYHKRGDLWDNIVSGDVTSEPNLFMIDNVPTAASVLARFDGDIADKHPRALRLDMMFPHAGRTLYCKNSSVKVNGQRLIDFYPSDVNQSLMDQLFLNGRAVGLRSSGAIETKVAHLVTDFPLVNSAGNRIPQPVSVIWKKTLEAEFNAAFSPDTHLGLSGWLANATLDLAGSQIIFSSNIDYSAVGSASQFYVMMANRPQLINAMLRNIGEMDRTPGLYEITGRTASTHAATGFFMDKTVIEPSGQLLLQHPRDFVPRGAFDLEAQLDGPPDGLVVFFPGEDTHSAPVGTRFDVPRGGTSATGAVSVTKIADAWFWSGARVQAPGQSSFGENFICLNVDLGIGSNDTSLAIMKGDKKIAALEIYAQASDATVDGQTGYVYAVRKTTKFERDLTTIADMPGEEPHKIVPTIVPQESSIGEMLLKILCSTNGFGTTSSTFDKFAFGAGLSDGTGFTDDFGADVDVDSFLSIPNPLGTEVFGPIVEDGSTILDVVEGLLNIAGYTVDISTDSQGLCRLRAVEIGLPNISDTVVNFTETNIAQSPVPKSETELSVTNVFNFSSNYNFENEPDVEVTVKDQVSIDLFNESNDLDVEMRGIIIDAGAPGDIVGTLRPVYSRLRLENSYPRRVVCFDAPTGTLQTVALGSTCTITHPHVRGPSGLGVTTEPGRVRSIEYDGYSPTGSIEMILYGVTGASWNMSLSIVGQNHPTTSTVFMVVNNDHSPSQRPSNGEPIEDLSAFRVGDYVDVFNVYEFDEPISAANQITFLNLSTNQITFASPVTLPQDTLSLGVSAFVVPVSFNNVNATDEQKKYAFINRTMTT